VLLILLLVVVGLDREITVAAAEAVHILLVPEP
jgi:hypothetical protein